MARVVGSVRLRHQQVPIPRGRQILRHIRDPLVMELEQFEVGIVVDQAQCVTHRVLQEIPDVLVDLESVEPPATPIPYPQISQHRFPVAGLADSHAVIANALGVDQP